MRGRVAAVPLLSLLLVFPLLADCNFTLGYSGQFRATVFDVAVDGSYLWTATGYGVQLLETSAAGPRILDSVPLPGSTRVIAANGNGLAYAGSGSKLIVLRRNGSQIEVVRSLEAPGVINEILITSHLFAATRSGIAHYDLVDPSNPARTSAVLTTSRPNVTSLAIAGNSLYAADGDTTVEIFNISIPSIPQRTGALDALPRAGAVHASSDGFLLVSDDVGQNTDVFSGTNRLARMPYGSTSFASTTTGALFVAGGDRTLRAVDLSDPARPAELFERQLAPTGGTSNDIFDLVRGGNTLYVAAGDLGLLTFDVSTLAPPFPLVSYGGGATTSALIIDGSTPKAYFTSAAGTITETSLQLATLRNSSTPGGPGILHDSRGSDLLVSSGAKVSLFSFSGTLFEATFRANVTQAALLGNTIVALLADQSVWTVTTTPGSAPAQVDTGGAKISQLARSATAYALAEVREEATTVRTILHVGTAKFTIDGAVTGGLALNATHAAFFTFRGINLVDLSSGAVTVLPNSTSVFPKQLQFAGPDLLVLGDRSLAVWNTSTRTLTRTHNLPANAVSMHAAAQRAVVATTEGMLAINYAAKLPDLLTEPDINRYYTKAVTGRDRLYLFGTDGVDVYSIGTGLAPRFVAAVREPGLIDVAATPDGFFTLGGDGAVTAYSAAGVQSAQTVVALGPDSQPEAIFTAGEAVWVSLSLGCQSGVCAKGTFVLDPKTLAVAGMIDGGVIDLAFAGTRAFAIFDLPGELIAFDIGNPLQPSPTAHIAVPARLTSIAVANDTVYAVGEKSYTYTTALVRKTEDAQAPVTQTPEVDVAGGCVIVSGRAENPELLGSAASVQVPSPVRSVAGNGDRAYVLTDHSIEVWVHAVPAPAKKRRSSR